MRKLSNPRSRAELIAAYAYATQPPPPPPQTGGQPDTTVGGKPYEPAPYHEEPDETVICPNCQKHNDTDASYCDQCGQKLAGSTDVKVEPAGEDPPGQAELAKPAVTAAGPGPSVPEASPVDAAGNVDGQAKCANPDCQHLASAHADMPDGMNTGACTIASCECMGMQVESQPNSGGGDSSATTGGQGAQGGPQSEELAHAPVIVPDAPAPSEPASTGQSDLNAPPPVDGGQNMGPAFTIPVAIIEGQPTGDGREIAPGALTWRTPPLPLMGLATETHDPEGFDQNDPAVICGRIDTFERSPGEGDTQLITAKGCYLANDDGQYFADLNEQMGRLGISADVAVQASEITVGDFDDDGWPSEMSEILTEGQIMGLTVCPYPAFEGAYIVLGDGQMDTPAKAIPDAPGPPAMGDETVTASVHWMTFEQCEPCDQGLELLTASGAGPNRPPAAWFDDPNFTEGDGRLQEIIGRHGTQLACPLTIEESGRVYGHLAPWNVCHIAKPGCVTAPQSKSDYAYFKRGQHVVTAEGDRVRVGTLTANAAHADLAASPTGAMTHYDNIATGAADVNVGEDEYGIWVAGHVRPTATAEQITALRASSISGDWRSLGGHLELVAALAVPVPGFPHAIVAGGEQEALLAAGASVMHRLKHPPAAVESASEGSYLRAFSRVLGKLARADARERIASLR